MIKKNLSFGFIILYLLGWQAIGNNSLKNYVANIPDAQKTSTPTSIPNLIKGGSKKIAIPSSKQSAPSGFLDQLTWMGTGGGGGGGEKQVCGACKAIIDESSLLLKQFKSQQKLMVVIYRETGGNACGYETAKYVTTLKIQVDTNGYFSGLLSGKTNDLFITDVYDLDTQKSLWNTAIRSNRYEKCTTNSSSVNSCKGAPAQRLKVDSMAYVCTVSDSVKLRDGPGKKYSILKSLVSGADLKIIGGPTCSDNWSWWQVETESGYQGWMSEGGDNKDKYFLCPTK